MEKTSSTTIKHTKKQRDTLFAVILTSLMTTFNGSSLNLSIPNIGSDFGASAQMVGWVVTAYALLIVALSLPFGKIADLTDKVRIFRVGILVFLAGIICCAISWNMWVMIFSRVLQGIGAAMVFATNMAILLDSCAPQERGKMLGLSSSATYIGLSIGPVLGGFINNYLGWRYIMVVSGAVALAAAICACTRLDVTPKEKIKGFDSKGSMLYIVAMVLVMYGMTLIGSGLLSYVLIAVGLALAVWFVRCENAASDPIVKVSLFRNPGFTYSSLAALMNYAATYAISYYMSIYLQVVKGCPSQFAGFILITSPLVQAIFSPLTGRLSDKYSPYKLSSAGMGVCATSLLLLCTLKESTGIHLIVGMLAIMGVGFALFASPNTNAIMSSVGEEDRSIASSIVATMRNAGTTTAMAIITVIVGMNLGSMGIKEAPSAMIVQTIHISFIIFSVICFIGIFLSLKRK